MRDMNKQRCYEIRESGKGIGTRVYTIVCSENELKQIAKTKNEMNGYIEGLGGDRTYAFVACEVLV